jgi:hypothetical protein
MIGRVASKASPKPLAARKFLTGELGKCLAKHSTYNAGFPDRSANLEIKPHYNKNYRLVIANGVCHCLRVCGVPTPEC